MQVPRKPEVMSPAGYWPQLRTAIEAGADSVYFGLHHFTARAKVGFSLEELPEVMATLHKRGVKGFVTFNTLEPIFDAEFARNTAKAAASNPNVTAEQLEAGKKIGMNVARYGVGIIMMVTMAILGLFTWLLGKVVGSAASLHDGLVIAAWSYFPRSLGAIAGGVQGLVMDPAKLNSQLSITLSPARFMDPATANPLLYQLAGRFDLFTIWVTILLAVGVAVRGKVSKERAALFGFLIWFVGGLYAFRTAYLSM